MKYAIISDIHSNLEAFQAVLNMIDQIGVDRIVCLGDVVGYNANPNECCNILREREIATILGNHDAVACGHEDPWGFNPVALAAAMWTRENLNSQNFEWLKNLPDLLHFDCCVAVHGAPRNRNTYLFGWEDIMPHLQFMQEQQARVCLVGHTHSPAIFSTDGVYTVDDDNRFTLGDNKIFFINAGSVGQPRDGNPQAAFGTLDTEKKEFQQWRVSYPIDATAAKIVAAGLPEFLAERLYLGR